MIGEVRRNGSLVAGAVRARHTVLVVEDDPWMRAYIVDLLEDAGYAVVTASNGPAALRLAPTLQPDSMLLDLQLPERSGWAVLAQLSAGPDTRDIAVIVVSGYVDGEPGERALADAISEKPFVGSSLLAELALAVSAHQSGLGPSSGPLGASGDNRPAIDMRPSARHPAQRRTLPSAGALSADDRS